MWCAVSPQLGTSDGDQYRPHKTASDLQGGSTKTLGSFEGSTPLVGIAQKRLAGAWDFGVKCEGSTCTRAVPV